MANKLSAAYYRTFINGVEYTIYMNNNKFLPAYWVENHDTMANYIEGTWAEIKALKDSSKLEPGTFYLINDYVTTTTQVETKVADHYFDVLVFALAKDHLTNINGKHWYPMMILMLLQKKNWMRCYSHNV